jgi:hypothetical protein
MQKSLSWSCGLLPNSALAAVAVDVIHRVSEPGSNAAPAVDAPRSKKGHVCGRICKPGTLPEGTHVPFIAAAYYLSLTRVLVFSADLQLLLQIVLQLLLQIHVLLWTACRVSPGVLIIFYLYGNNASCQC